MLRKRAYDIELLQSKASLEKPVSDISVQLQSEIPASQEDSSSGLGIFRYRRHV